MRSILFTGIFLLTSLLNAQTIHVSEDFNSGTIPSGWTNSAISGTQNWSFGINASINTTGNSNINGTALAYFDDDALGATSTNNTASLTTPSFDNSGDSLTFLEFDYNFRQFNGVADSFLVDVFDGSTWQRVLSVGVDDCGRWNIPACIGNFPKAQIDISVFKNTNCQVRFTYDDGNDWGWFVGIDNVQIYSPPAIDLGVSEIIGLVTSCGLTNEPVEVRIRNLGSNSISSFNVTFNVNNGSQLVTEIVNTAILAQDSLRYTFTSLANLSQIGNYSIQAYTTINGDSIASNDSTSIGITNEVIYTPTYSEDFESQNHGWTTSGSSSSWARGVPVNAFINSAAGGQNAFVTNLSGNYNRNELSYITSPCLDFSSKTADPILSFSFIHQLEGNNFDQAWVEYSTDNGIIWAKLPASAAFTPQNWYNNTSFQIWNGASQGWISVENTLDGLAGEPNVKIRFVMSSDGSTNFEGLGIDNVSIRDRQLKDFSLNEITNPSTSSTSLLCGYGRENIIVRYENKGNSIIDSIFFAYQVDNGPISRDTLVTSLAPTQILTYTFRNQYDFSAPRSYQLKTWGSTPGDTFNLNDSSATRIIDNTQSGVSFSIPYVQTFDQMSVGSPFSLGWTSVPSSIGSTSIHAWNVGTGGTWVGRQGTMTSSFDTGPDEDCSGRGNAAFLETSGTGPVPILESPCINLSNTLGARLIFQYHMYGSQMGTLSVDVYDGVNWVNVDAISGQQQANSSDAWKSRTVNLNAFTGRRIKVRFRGIRGSGFRSDMAVDCIRIEPIPNYDLSLKSIDSPFSQGCYSTSSANQPPFEIGFENVGMLNFPSGTAVGIEIDDDTTIFTSISFSLISSNDYTVNLGNLYNFSPRKKPYKLKIWLDANLDENRANDTLIKFYTFQNQTAQLIESFDDYNDVDCFNVSSEIATEGIWSIEGDNYQWFLQNSNCQNGFNGNNPGSSTGPIRDRSGDGNFIFAGVLNKGNVTAIQGDTATLTSRCIGSSSSSSSRLVEFWYYRYGSANSMLVLQEVINGTTAINRTSITGAFLSGPEENWEVLRLPITNNPSNLRFFAIRGPGVAPQITALDDISVYVEAPIDIAIDKIISPSKDSCSYSNTQLTIELYNRGSSQIAANSLQLSYTLGSQTVTETVSNSINSRSSLQYTFSTNLNMNFGGKATLQVNATLAGDTFLLNNTLEKELESYQIRLPYFQDFEEMRTSAIFQNDDLNGWIRRGNSNLFHIWRPWQGEGEYINGRFTLPSIQVIYPNGTNGDHTFSNSFSNGKGRYLKIRHDYIPVVADAILESPCGPIILPSSSTANILLSFWYNFYHDLNANPPPTLFVDIFNGSSWINGLASITGPVMNSSNEPWAKYRLDLSSFGSNNNLRFRFRVEKDSLASYSSEIGIDDLEIKERSATDVSLDEIIFPESNCNLSNQSLIRIRTYNEGTSNLTANSYSYAIRYTDLNGRDSLFNTVTESVTGVLIAPLTDVQYDFTNRADLSRPGRYEIKIWSNNVNDGYRNNDTITKVIDNFSKPFPYIENFSTLEENEKARDDFRSRFSNGWLSSDNYFAPHTATSRVFPGHTEDYQDKYLYFESFATFEDSYFESPCVDLSSSSFPVMEFWYRGEHYGQDGKVEILERSFGLNTLIDTLEDLEHEWKRYYRAIEEDNNANNKVIRIQYNGLDGGQFAFDDFSIKEADSIGIRVDKFIEPISQNCNFTGSSRVGFRVFNDGSNPIDSFRAVLNVDSSGIAIARRDETFAPSSSILPFTYDDFFFTIPINFDANERYRLSITIECAGESYKRNNALDTIILDQSPLQWTDTIRFSDLPLLPIIDLYNYDKLWWNYDEGSSSRFYWRYLIANGSPRTTGPSFDQTPGGNEGYIGTTFRSGAQSGDTAYLNSRCIDLSNFTVPKLNFWYHKFGNQMGDLFIELNNGSGWVKTDSIMGQIQNSSFDPWIGRSIDLSSYTGQSIQFRFTAIANGVNGVIGLDDIYLSDSSFITTIIPNETRPPTLSIYPNPNNGEFTIEISEELIGEEYQVIDLSGKVIIRSRFNRSFEQIQIIANKGIYLIRIPSKNIHQKVVVY